jgi:hypothetical protein
MPTLRPMPPPYPQAQALRSPPPPPPTHTRRVACPTAAPRSPRPRVAAPFLCLPQLPRSPKLRTGRFWGPCAPGSLHITPSRALRSRKDLRLATRPVSISLGKLMLPPPTHTRPSTSTWPHTSLHRHTHTHMHTHRDCTVVMLSRVPPVQRISGLCLDSCASAPVEFGGR